MVASSATAFLKTILKVGISWKNPNFFDKRAIEDNKCMFYDGEGGRQGTPLCGINSVTQFRASGSERAGKREGERARK